MNSSIIASVEEPNNNLDYLRLRMWTVKKSIKTTIPWCLYSDLFVCFIVFLSCAVPMSFYDSSKGIMLCSWLVMISSCFGDSFEYYVMSYMDVLIWSCLGIAYINLRTKMTSFFVTCRCGCLYMFCKSLYVVLHLLV